MPHFLNLKKIKNPDYLIAGLLFFLTLLYYGFVFINADQLSSPNTYQSRDLRRAIELFYQHKLIWHGPELSGGGFLPGPLYYVLIGWPMYLSGSFFSVYWLEYIMVAGGLSVVWLFIKKQHGALSAALFYLLFLSSPFFNGQLLQFMNSDFQFLFLFLAFIGFSKLESDLFLSLGALALGCALQMHFTPIVLLPSVLLAIVVSRTLSVRQRLFKSALILFFVLLPCLPYLIFRLFINSDKTDFFDTGSAVLKLVTMTQKFGLQVSMKQTAPFLQLFVDEFYAVPALIFLAWKLKDVFYKNAFLIFATFGSLLALFPVLLSAGVSRYGILFFFMTCFVFSVYVVQIKKTAQRRLFLGCSILLIIYNFSGVLLPVAQALEPSARPLRLKAGSELVSSIIKNTGWTFEYFRDHSYFNGLNAWDDFSVLYRERYSAEQGTQVRLRYDGLFALRKGKSAPLRIQQAFGSGQISCQKKESVEGLDICYYIFNQNEPVRRWANVGYAYDFDPGSVQLQNDFSGVKEISNRTAVIYNNECGYESTDCQVEFNLHVLADSMLRVEVLGFPLTVFDPYNAPRWTWTVKRPQLDVQCGNEVTSYVLADGLGHDQDRSYFTTPFDEFFKLKCKVPKSITLVLKKNISFFMVGSGKNNQGIVFGSFEKKWELSR